MTHTEANNRHQQWQAQCLTCHSTTNHETFQLQVFCLLVWETHNHATYTTDNNAESKLTQQTIIKCQSQYNTNDSTFSLDFRKFWKEQWHTMRNCSPPSAALQTLLSLAASLGVCANGSCWLRGVSVTVLAAIGMHSFSCAKQRADRRQARHTHRFWNTKKTRIRIRLCSYNNKAILKELQTDNHRFWNTKKIWIRIKKRRCGCSFSVRSYFPSFLVFFFASNLRQRQIQLG
jgi:hypothetical protein